jgi:polyphosphate kinase
MANDKDRSKADLKLAQIELVKLQRHVIANQCQILVIFEGRDAAGKDGAIKRIIQYLSPRDVRVVALGAPSDYDKKAWYFQRYVAQLPIKGEIVLFNRSWYNRAGVERVMNFCTNEDYEAFFKIVPSFEEVLINSSIKLVKYYLDISEDEQKKRLQERRDDPLSQWKISPIDSVAIEHFKDYSLARNEMLKRTHTAIAPWTIIKADDKPTARINIIRDLLNRLEFSDKNSNLILPDPKIVLEFQEDMINKTILSI